MKWHWPAYTIQLTEWVRYQQMERTLKDFHFCCSAVRILNKRWELFQRLSKT